MFQTASKRTIHQSHSSPFKKEKKSMPLASVEAYVNKQASLLEIIT